MGDRQPVLLKAGLAIAISLAGLLASRLRRSSPSPPGADDRIDASDDHKEGLQDAHGSSRRSNKSSGDEGGIFLLPEFNDLVMREFGRDPDRSSPTTNKSDNNEDEQSNRLRPLECYGVQDQEPALHELESQTKIDGMELEFYALQIKSLQSENQRLREQTADQSRAMVELELLRIKNELLKKRMLFDAEQAKGKIDSLSEIIRLLESRTKITEDGFEIERKLARLEELEGEVIDLRIVNSKLIQEKSELSQKLVSARSSPSLFNTSTEAEAVKEGGRLSQENEQLRKENEQLRKEIEQLKNDRFTDLEQLVYLKWINACLRYELRDYQPPPGKKTAVARDLSRCLSPESEQRAKQLIVEYAAGSGLDIISPIGVEEFESEHSLSSQSTTEFFNDVSVDASSSLQRSNTGSSGKLRFFGKLRNLVLGKDKGAAKVKAFDRNSASWHDPVAGRRQSTSGSSSDGRCVVGRTDSFGSYLSFTGHQKNDILGTPVAADEKAEIIRLAGALQTGWTSSGSGRGRRKWASFSN